MIKKCYCGKEFVTYPSKIKLGKGKYCSKECCLKVTNKILEENGKSTRFEKGNLPHNYKGYSYTQARPHSGVYKLIYIPDHPKATVRKQVREHRLVMEKHIGRILRDDEVVHHIDGNTLNNDISNLELMNKKDHDRMNVELNVHRRWIERRKEAKQASSNQW